jgi:fatty acid desaturase
MEEKERLIETLLDRAVEFGKTSLELLRLKTVDKTSDIVSSVVLHSIVFVLIILFLLFLNMGVAFWLGDLLGQMWLGFFVVAAFYGFTGIIFHYLIHKRIKRQIADYIIKKIMK